MLTPASKKLRFAEVNNCSVKDVRGHSCGGRDVVVYFISVLFKLIIGVR